MPPHPSRSLRLSLVLLTAAVVSPALRLSAQTSAPPATPPPSQPAAPAKPPGIYERLIALWADVPAYHDRLTSTAPGPRKPAQLISAFSPASPFPLPDGTEIKVNVALVISDTGKVEAARILDSTDARFNQAAIDGVKQWLFRPALGDDGPRISFTVAPIIFHGAPKPAPRHIMVGFDQWVHNVSSPTRLSGRFAIRNDGGSPIRAGRMIISHAEDDTGLVLKADGPGDFFTPSLGILTSAEDLFASPHPALSFSLSAAAPTATKLRTLEGVTEFIIPDLDPNATAIVKNAPATYGSPVRSAALHAQGVSLVLFDKPTADRFAQVRAAGGLADYVYSGPDPADKTLAARFDPNQQMRDGDIAVGIDDPHSRLVGIEFQTADGQSLRYLHNPRYHASSSANGKRLDLYAVQLPPDAQLVCWLITEKSLQKVPFKIPDLPLPPRN